MKIISHVLLGIIPLFIFSESVAQDTLDYKTAFPSGVFISYGFGSYSVRDEYISKQRYSGALTYLNVEWVRFHEKSAFHAAFEYRSSSKISNNNISAKVGQFTFNQDYSYFAGKPFGNIFAYVGPSIQVFYYGIDYDFAEPGTFISPKTFGLIASLGVNSECIYQLNEVLIFEGLVRLNTISFIIKDNDEQKFGDESSPILATIFTATKADLVLSARYQLVDDISICLGYKFDLSRIDKWDPYIAASNNVFTSINYDL